MLSGEELFHIVSAAVRDALVVLDESGSVLEWSPQAEALSGWDAREAHGRSLQQLILPDRFRPRFEADMRDLRRDNAPAGGTAVRRIEMRRRDGGELPVELTLAATRFDEGWVFAASLRQPTSTPDAPASGLDGESPELESREQERTAHLERINEDLRRSEARFRTLVSSMGDLVFTLDREERFTGIFGRGLEGMGAGPEDFVGRSVKEKLGDELYSALSPYLRRALAGESLVFEIAPPGLEKRTLLHSLSPLRDGQGRILELVGTCREISELKNLQRHVLEVSEWEHQRIGQDLHDGLGQELAGIAFYAKMLARGFAAKSLPESEHMEELARLISQATDQSRILARGMFPVELEGHGLALALEDLCKGMERLLGIACRLRLPEEIPSVDKEVGYHLYRIVQEAVHYAARHGQARNVVVSLLRDDRRAELRIEDDGRGIPPEAELPGAASGMGIAIMRYRATLLGGTLSLAPGREGEGGTRVSCTFRLPASSSE